MSSLRTSTRLCIVLKLKPATSAVVFTASLSIPRVPLRSGLTFHRSLVIAANLALAVRLFVRIVELIL